MCYIQFLFFQFLFYNMNHNNSNNSNNSNINIIYYSRVSQMCRNLLQLLNEYNAINCFMLKCIDDMKELPQSLERVPTVIICGIGKPLVGNEAFKWFNENRMFLQTKSTELRNKRILHNMDKNMYDPTGPKGYSTNELEGLSDDFAFTTAEQAQPKSFCGYGQDTDVIYTPSNDGKINMNVQQRMLNEYKNIIDTQTEEYKQYMKQDQINKIIEKEKEELYKNRMGL